MVRISPLLYEEFPGFQLIPWVSAKTLLGSMAELEASPFTIELSPKGNSCDYFTIAVNRLRMTLIAPKPARCEVEYDFVTDDGNEELAKAKNNK